jgi:hypothetical protein
MLQLICGKEEDLHMGDPEETPTSLAEYEAVCAER